MRAGAALVVVVALAGCGNAIVEPPPGDDGGAHDAGAFDAASCQIDLNSFECMTCVTLGEACCAPACVIGGCDPAFNNSCKNPIACVDPSTCAAQ